ncbi:MAG: glycosyl hydrolase [Janthinobacterium lividum]
MQPIIDVGRADFSWYYDWEQTALPSATPRNTSALFAPMVWNASDVTSAHLSAIKASGATTLLGFNEPDNSSQADMSVNQALSLWPSLMATGLRLGSPAPTTNDTIGENSWLAQFMSTAKSDNLTVDFIAVHYYSTDQSVDVFKNWLEAVYAQYNKPIWVTEWCLADWNDPGRFSATDQASFAQAGTKMMDSLPFVERQAWFAAYNGGDGWNLNSGVFDASGNLTPVGLAFRELNTAASDTTLPLLTAAEKTSGLTNMISVDLSGTVIDARGVAGVEIYDVSGGLRVDLGAATIGSNGTWTLQAAGLTDGVHQFTAAATDISGSKTGQISVSIGCSPDQSRNCLTLQMSEDAWNGDAQFTIQVDGKQIGDTQTATAFHSAGQTQAFTVLGTFTGAHTATVTFLNDAYGGTSSTDRNLYVNSASFNGATISGASLTEYSAGPQSFGFTGPAPASTSITATTIGSGSDSLILQMSEDAWNGDAQFTIQVDGKQIGDTQTATAFHSAGQTQALTVLGTFTGAHTATVTFLNDAYGGTSSTDRNLYVNSATFNGATVSGASLIEYSAGPQSFGFHLT